MEIFTGMLVAILLYFPGGARLCARDQKWARQYKEQKVEKVQPVEQKADEQIEKEN